jgi:paraquat-inducible protein A
LSDVNASQMACHECDLLIDVPALADQEKAFCPRCDYLLAENRPGAQEAIFAYSISALMFLMLANAFPFLGFSASGQERVVSLLQSVAILVTENIPSLAAVVFASIILIPALFLIAMIYVSLAIRRGRQLPGTSIVLRSAMSLLPWSMSEIFLIGILVSFVKISSIADVSLGLSFWSYVLFTLCMSAAVMHIDKREIWQRVLELRHD